MGIYERIRDTAKKQGISVARLEREAGLQRSSISKWNIHVPSSEKVQRVADRLNISSEYILTGKRKKWDIENAHILAKATKDPDLLAALEVFYSLKKEQRKNIINLILLYGK